MTSISDIGGAYAQNAHKLKDWGDKVDAGIIPVERGAAMSDDDVLRRFIINRVMCLLRLDLREVAEKFGPAARKAIEANLQRRGEGASGRRARHLRRERAAGHPARSAARAQRRDAVRRVPREARGRKKHDLLADGLIPRPGGAGGPRVPEVERLMEHTAIFLMNLGGPRSLEEVEPYLYELFSDPLVISAPFGPFRPLVAKLISRFRAPSSAEKYALIGGKSPIVEGTGRRPARSRPSSGPGSPVTSRCAAAIRTRRRPSVTRSARERPARSPSRSTRSSRTRRRRAPSLELRRGVAEGPEPRRGLHLARPRRATSTPPPPRSARCSRRCRRTSRVRPRRLQRARAADEPGEEGRPVPRVHRALGARDARAGRRAESRSPTRAGSARRSGSGRTRSRSSRANARDRTIVAVPIAFVSEHLETLYDLDILARRRRRRPRAPFPARPRAGRRPDFVAALAHSSAAR